MTEYTASTNLIGWVAARIGLFGWPTDGAEAEVIERMEVGDSIVPKFAQNPDFGSQADFVKEICKRFSFDYEREHSFYEDVVKWGEGAVPFVWTVTSGPRLNDRFPNDVPWMTVEISQRMLDRPFSTSEFLRLRELPLEIARQFKAMAAPGRHVLELPPGATSAIETFGREGRERAPALRSLSLVKEPPIPNLERAGRPPLRGDLVFVVGDSRMTGFHQAERSGQLTPAGERIELAPSELPDLIERARERATEGDRFYALNATAAATELADFAASAALVRDVPEFGTFYDRYVLLPKKVSQALELSERDVAPFPLPEYEEAEEEEEGGEGGDSEQAELDNLHGLTVSAVRGQVPDLELPDAVLAEAVTALRAGKHLLLSGPPGTGKSTIASGLCRAVVNGNFDIVTATADWTTFETIGGYMPRGKDELEFEPGVVLRALQPGRWLVVDEINRADIDKAFGPLFTLLAASADGDGASVVLPYRQGERSIRIVRAERRKGASSPYAVTPAWRLIGTLNVRDKATLFRLSFAFLRRFAIVDVPLPEPSRYREIYDRWSGKLEGELRESIVDGAMALASGPRELGPAILKDIAEFINIGTVATDTANRVPPYEDPVIAFLTAVRLYAVPQYEGARKADSDLMLQRLAEFSPQHRESDAWRALVRAFERVVLS